MQTLIECFSYGFIREQEAHDHQDLMDFEDQEEEIEPLNYYDNDEDFEIE
jgi:hypothetical protein